MKSRVLRAIAAAVLAVVAAAGAAAQAPRFAQPFVPGADSAVLQKVPAASDPAVREMAALRSRVDAHAGDPALADRLARAYIDYGRRIGDGHYAGYAEAVVAPWLARPAPPPALLVTQATILQFRHQFTAARALLERALAQDPRLAQGWLTLATLDLVEGRYDAAREHCARAGRHGGFALGLACSGHVLSYVGQAEQSIALLSRIADDAPGIAPAFKAWVQGMLAESNERLGRFDAAETHYRKALAHAPGDNFLLVAYADLLLDRGRPRDVVRLLAGSEDADTACLRVALAHAALGGPEAGRYAWTMAARYAGYAVRGIDYFDRERVRFVLHVERDPVAALAIAQRNWEIQRAPWDARVLLEAALAARQPEAAAPVIAFVRESGLQDPAIASLVQRLTARVVAGARR